MKSNLAQDCYKNTSEVIRADLWLLEEEEEHLTLKAAVREGLDSGILVGFDSGEHLRPLKKTKA